MSVYYVELQWRIPLILQITIYFPFLKSSFQIITFFEIQLNSEKSFQLLRIFLHFRICSAKYCYYGMY